MPERSRYVAPQLLADAFDMEHPHLELRLVLDASGHIAEARALGPDG